MSKVVELFGISKTEANVDWSKVVEEQPCPYLQKRCIKIRKSQPEVSIGTCTVMYGKQKVPTIICPHRLLERKQIFTDCLHLLTTHQPGNELHVVTEVSLPGGNVDYFLLSVNQSKVRDFVGIELQALDTTGTVWPERKRLLEDLGVETNVSGNESRKSFGINWKMTAKTSLVQLHHKIDTFEKLQKKLVLVVQDCFLSYMQRQFNFAHVKQARIGDSMHMHSYQMVMQAEHSYKLTLEERLSTDAVGIAKCLDLQAEANVELEQIIQLLESKISEATLFTLV
ncbi:MAG: hypothetical protein EBE86_030075 [Hormoscilla sp. GUM202]|nr:hypothetical protein [Hormoscilla sp. GUM202]